MSGITLEFRIRRDAYVSQNDRLHHHAKAKKVAHLRHLGQVVGSSRGRVSTPCEMRVHVGWPDRRRRDRINASSTVKALMDGAVVAGVIEDDSDAQIVSETYTSHVAGDRDHIHITITLTPTETDQ